MPSIPKQRNYWHATVSPSGKITTVQPTVATAQTEAAYIWSRRYMARTGHATFPSWAKAKAAGWKVLMVKVDPITALSAAEYARER